MEELTRIFRLWYSKWKRLIGTKGWTFNLDDFLSAYDRCRLPGGIDWVRIVREAKAEELPPDKDWYSANMKALARLCARLQRLHGDKPLYLSYEDAGCQLKMAKNPKTAKRTAQAAFKLLMRDGLLKRVSVGCNVTRKASEYLWLPCICKDDGECI